MTGQSSARKYLAVIAGVAVFLLLAEIAINYLADPLFFFGGNKVSGRAYYLNERISVIARNRNRWPQIDCLIFGSSRMTFFDASRVTGYHCANMAVSGGLVDEFARYEQYLKARGVKPRLIIIGVDNYSSELTLKDVPAFVLKGEELPSWIGYYTSIDSLWFSLEALTGHTRSPNYYDRNYRKYIGWPMRRPGQDHKGDEFYVLPGQENAVAARIPYYRKLCDIFPKARCVGIVPPVSTWGIEKALNLGIEPYLKGMETLSGVFDGFYDFSIPAQPTWDFTQSSDGIHFSAKVHDHIAQKISDPASESWGFDLKALPPAQYERQYIETAQQAVAARKKLNVR